MAIDDLGTGPIETLIGFKLNGFEAQHGHAVLMRLELASAEYGVRVVSIHCTAAWADALAESLSKVAGERSDPTIHRLAEGQ